MREIKEKIDILDNELTKLRTKKLSTLVELKKHYLKELHTNPKRKNESLVWCMKAFMRAEIEITNEMFPNYLDNSAKRFLIEVRQTIFGFDICCRLPRHK